MAQPRSREHTQVAKPRMDDSSCQKIISKLESQILKLENELKEPTISIIRENRLNELEV